MKKQQGFISLIILLVSVVIIVLVSLYLYDNQIKTSGDMNNKEIINEAKKVANSVSDRILTIPKEFSLTGVEQNIQLRRDFILSTEVEKSAREVFWKDNLNFVKNELSCTGSDCVDAHLGGYCGGVNMKIKKKYDDYGVLLYNALFNAKHAEFPMVVEC